VRTQQSFWGTQRLLVSFSQFYSHVTCQYLSHDNCSKVITGQTNHHLCLRLSCVFVVLIQHERNGWHWQRKREDLQCSVEWSRYYKLPVRWISEPSNQLHKEARHLRVKAHHATSRPAPTQLSQHQSLLTPGPRSRLAHTLWKIQARVRPAMWRHKVMAFQCSLYYR